MIFVNLFQLNYKTMKAVIMILSLILFVSWSESGFAQSRSDCKFEIDQTDSKTGKAIKKIKTKLTGTDNFFLLISRNDTAYQLILNFWIARAMVEPITKNEVATIKLSGGQNLQLKTISTTKPIGHYSDQTWAEYSPEYPIRSADLAKFKTISPLNVSLSVSDEQVFREFNVKDYDKIKDMVRCIMKD
jgi:hypothetical protein